MNGEHIERDVYYWNWYWEHIGFDKLDGDNSIRPEGDLVSDSRISDSSSLVDSSGDGS